MQLATIGKNLIEWGAKLIEWINKPIHPEYFNWTPLQLLSGLSITLLATIILMKVVRLFI